MQCRSCGTEIADKAIVCYRCGAATSDPVRKPVPVPRSKVSPFRFVGAALLALAAIYAWYASQTAADPERWQTIAAALLGAAIVVVVMGVIRGRLRR
jgi:fatty acid desaturase